MSLEIGVSEFGNIHDMSAPPHNEPSATPKGEADGTDNVPTPSEAIAIFLNWAKHYWDAPRHKAKWTEGATVVLTLLIAVAAFCSAYIFERQFETMQRQEMWGLEPFIDLTKAIVVVSPLDPDKPIVAFTLTNKGKSPGKNVRVEAFLELRTKGTPLKPRRKECLPKYGSTYPSDNPEIIIKKMEDGISQAKIVAYRGGEERLYLYGSVKYQDFWRQDRPGEEPPTSEFRSSIFCRSFGKENEEFLRVKHPPEGAAIMVPCTAEEWPFDDHHEPESSYAGCSQEENKNPN
jgi:hypothetical protein